ncbi:MAG: XRE family transcriptional regulator [Saprospiraceae bacterium]|nr:XRE family transcriptional regulator [Candidatus Defluviibacterium haderslevense]MBK7244166.1 XRE family transcriptional regulator [Candidatus Defluviibacterium haderslevense]
MKKIEKVGIIIEKTRTGFSAYAVDIPIYTTGKNIAELIGNANEATQLYYEEDKKASSKFIIQYQIDFKQFFQYYRVLNAKVIAEKIGMNPTLLSQYVQGKKKPSQMQTERIINAIHEIGVELSSINLINA